MATVTVRNLSRLADGPCGKRQKYSRLQAYNLFLFACVALRNATTPAQFCSVLASVVRTNASQNVDKMIVHATRIAARSRQSQSAATSRYLHSEKPTGHADMNKNVCKADCTARRV